MACFSRHVKIARPVRSDWTAKVKVTSISPWYNVISVEHSVFNTYARYMCVASGAVRGLWTLQGQCPSAIKLRLQRRGRAFVSAGSASPLERMTVAAIVAAAANLQICRRFIGPQNRQLIKPTLPRFLGSLKRFFRLIEAHRNEIPPQITPTAAKLSGCPASRR